MAIYGRSAVGAAEFFSIERRYATAECLGFPVLHTALLLVCAVSKGTLLNSLILTARLSAFSVDLGAVLHCG